MAGALHEVIVIAELSVPTLATFCIYILGMLAIGAYAYMATSNLDDYLLGGRRLGPTVTALSAGASDMSGWLLLGVPGAVYLGGLSEAWILVGLFVGAFCNWTWVAGRLRSETERLNAITLPDFFAARFADESGLLRLASALVILIFFTFYAASGMVAGATLFTTTFGLSYSTALLVGAVVIVTYTAIGGFLAVSWTDLVQGLMMLLALIAVPLVVLGDVGVAATGEAIRAVDPSRLAWFGDLTLVGLVSLLAWGLGYFGQPHILARFMAIEAGEKISQARWTGLGWMAATSAGALGVGLTGIAFLHNAGAPLEAADSERVFIILTQLVFNPWIAGILLAGILAAVMSTIDSQLLVSSSALSEDFYKTWLRPEASQQELVLVGRLTVLMIAALAVAIAWNPEAKVLGLVSYAWAGLGASFGPVVLCSLYWQGMTGRGALAGMVTGALTVIIWKQLEGGLFDVYELLPAFLLALLAIRLGSVGGPATAE